MEDTFSHVAGIKMAGDMHGTVPFATIVETINDGILLCTLDATIVYANLSMATMLGYTREEMVGCTLFDFMDAEWAAFTRANLERRKEGVEEMFDHLWTHKNGGGVWTMVSAKPMVGDDGVQWGSLVAIQDISNRKRMEEELREARDELEIRVAERTEQLTHINAALEREVAERTEAEHRALEASRAKSAFLANMSHELRTPLNAVIGYTELVLEDLDLMRDDVGMVPVEGIEQDLGKVHSAATHLLALINDILDLSKVEAGKMELFLETFDLNQLLAEVVDTIRPLALKNQNQILWENKDSGFREFVADQTKLKQVLLNLTSNAAKFTENGRIRLETSRIDIENKPGLQIDVSDTGMGISIEKVARLFDPFTQADESTTRKHGGTGLGLTICKRFCELMGAEIDVKSEVGKGTTFSVLLPLVEDPSFRSIMRDGSLDETSELYEVDQSDGPLVLVIDDDVHMHELMRRFLVPRGFRVASAQSAALGLDMAADLLPDVITLDVMMPGKDGWFVLSTLKSDATLQSIPVVMVTMVDDKGIGYALGASEYLVKPIQRDRLLQVLSRFANNQGRTALVVEDESDIRDLIARHLRRADWNVRTAGNGVEALALLEDEHPDVVILDLMMPEMDGFELAERMRDDLRWTNIPIIVVTAMELSIAEQARLQFSVERILNKNIRSIEQVVQEVLEVTGREVTD